MYPTICGVLILAGLFTKGVHGAGRLVIHVGPHKTGTSSAQTFLVEHAAWVYSRFGVRIGAAHDPGQPKLGCIIPNTILHRNASLVHLGGRSIVNKRFVSEKQYGQIMSEIRTWCDEGQTVLLSSEDFSGFEAADYAPLKALCSDISIVHAHREESGWVRSTWGFHEEAAAPKSLGAFLVDEHPRRWANGVDLLDRIEAAVGPKNTIGVSYEVLLEERVQLQEFLVCNATMQFTGAKFTECHHAFSAFEEVHENPSSSLKSIALDVHRLARAAWLLHPPCTSQNDIPRIKDTAIEAVALMLPTTCSADGTRTSRSILAAISRGAAAEWYYRTGARSPKTLTSLKPICLVDESLLTRRHWESIRNLIPPCPGAPALQVSTKSKEIAPAAGPDSNYLMGQGEGPAEERKSGMYHKPNHGRPGHWEV